MKTVSLAFGIVLLFSLTVAANHVPQSDIIPDVPRDGIPPLDDPKYESVVDATWLEEDDWVISYERNGDARAFPVKIMNWHEIVNDTIGGLEVLVSYCPLCRSGLVFDRHLNAAEISPEARGVLPQDALLSFGNTGSLYENDMVMYDRNTNSRWFQVGGEALIGPLHGVVLKRLPASMMIWNIFQKNYPDGLVLSRDTGYIRDYERDVFARYGQNHEQIFFPISEIDDRLPAKSRILGLKFDGISKAYNLSTLSEGIYADQVGSQPVVLFVQKGAGVAFNPQVAGKVLSFVVQGDRFVDEQTQSMWEFSGRASSGELEGAQLERLTQSNLYWFSWALLEPETIIVPEYADFVPYPSSVDAMNTAVDILNQSPTLAVNQHAQGDSGSRTSVGLWWMMLGAIVAGLGVWMLLSQR